MGHQAFSHATGCTKLSDFVCIMHDDPKILCWEENYTPEF